jgi:hypothetical protein
MTGYLSLQLLVHLTQCVEMFGEICVNFHFLAFDCVTLVRWNEAFKPFLSCSLGAGAILFIKILIVCTELFLKAKTRLGDMKNEFYLMNIPLTDKKLGSHMMQNSYSYILIIKPTRCTNFSNLFFE